jgi:hypothetical protein
MNAGKVDMSFTDLKVNDIEVDGIFNLSGDMVSLAVFSRHDLNLVSSDELKTFRLETRNGNWYDVAYARYSAVLDALKGKYIYDIAGICLRSIHTHPEHNSDSTKGTD